MAGRYGRKADRALAVWVKLARAFASVDRLTTEDIRRYGLTQPQFGVLDVLGHRGEMTLGDLSRRTLSSGGNTTVVVNNLEREGLVVRRRCMEDGRVMYVGLSPRGRRLFRRIFPRHARAVEQIMGVLSPEEQEALAVLLRKLGRRAAAAGGDTLNSK